MLEKVTAGEAVREIISSLRARSDLDRALGDILSQVRALFRAAEAYLLLVEGDRLRLQAYDGLPVGVDTTVTLAVGEGIEGVAAARGEMVTVPDTTRHAGFADPFGRSRSPGAMAAAPMSLRGRVTGVLVVGREEPGQFGGSDLWWLDVLGGLAALAIEDDRIYRTQERRARQAEVLAAIALDPTGQAETVLPRLAEHLARTLEVSRVDLLLADARGTELVSRGLDPNGATAPFGGRISVEDGGPLARVYTTAQPFLCNEACCEPEVCRLFGEGKVESIMAVPVIASARVKGVLYLANERRTTFSQDDLAFVSIVGARVGGLLEQEDLRQRQLQLQRAEAEARARQDVLGIVSHELKTPVAVIQAYTDLLLRRAERAGGRDANTEVVERIAEQADRMLGLIDQLLDLQRLEAGLFTLEVHRFDLALAARRVCEELQATTQSHEVKMKAGGPVVVSADRRRIEEVLLNLVDNAIKYSPAGGEIEIAVAPPEPGRDQAVVAVSDRGLGIPSDEQEKVFERFYQGGARLRRGHVGLGLGLYISREIVKRHGGEMWLESEFGRGSTFYFSLPAAGPEEP